MLIMLVMIEQQGRFQLNWWISNSFAEFIKVIRDHLQDFLGIYAIAI